MKLYTHFDISCWNLLRMRKVLHRPQMAKRIRIACTILKATLHTHSEYVIRVCFSSATMVVILRLNITLYVRCLSGLTFDSGSVHLNNASRH